MILHPESFVALIPEHEREQWKQRAFERASKQDDFWTDVLMGQRQAFVRRTTRRFESPDGSVCQAREESSMLLNPQSRLDPTTGYFTDENS